MSFSFGAGVRDSLSNLAASLGAGKDKASHDAFTVFDLGRAQVEAMYRGDWLARKVVDIVPYDSVRAWRSWSGHRADVARFEAAERRLGLRKTVQRAMVLGRLYGGGAILIGDGEQDIAALARPLDPRLPRGGLRYLHAVSRWQLGVSEIDLNPLSPWCGEPKSYTLSAPGLSPLELHPSRVVRFLGNPLPDPSVAGGLWSDSVLQSLYDAVHAAALSLAGATSLLHEAKVDVVTVPNLSEHLSSAETTEQLSARFAYAAAMKSMNNLLLLGDGESWSRQSVDFAGLPEMARTFLQVAAGAADIPVTRLLGQSPSGLSSTGESDVRNYYDMIAARQELDLRPQLERLDRLICWSEDIDEGALGFAFRPLWQLDEPSKAALALSKAQATQVYAGLKLWPAEMTAKLVEAQLIADGTYPNAAAVFADRDVPDPGDSSPTLDYDPAEPRDLRGWWTRAGGGAGKAAGVARAPSRGQAEASHPPLSLSGLLGLLNPIGTVQAAEEPSEDVSRRSEELAEPADLQPDEVMRSQRFTAAWEALKQIDPDNDAFRILRAPGASTSEAEVERLERAVREAAIKRTCDFLRPDGKPIGERGTSSKIRVMSGGLAVAQQDYDYLSQIGTPVPFAEGSMVRLPYAIGTITLRPLTSTPGSPAIDVNIPGIIYRRLHY